MNELLEAMSIAELKRFKSQYKNNEAVCKIVDGYIEARLKEEQANKAKDTLKTSLLDTLSKLDKPDDLYNIYLRFAEVEEVDEDAEAVEVEIVDDDGNKHTELRKPTRKVKQWVVEFNKAFTVISKSSGGSNGSKRAISVYKHHTDKADELIGHFPTGSDACKYLGIKVGGNSAPRLLRESGYILQPYEGTDFTEVKA